MAQVPELVKTIHPQFSGQIVLVRNGERAKWNYGLANRNWQLKMQDQAVMDIASLNKSFIANLCLQAVEEGRWELNQSLNSMLENLGLDNRFHDSIRLIDLLIHRSGLRDYDAVPSNMQAYGFQSFKRSRFNNKGYLDFIEQLPANLPHTDFLYSNFAYHLLAVLLEELYQEDFNSLLKRKICIPLEMRSTSSTISRQDPVPNLALAYQLQGKTWKENDYIDLTLGRRIFSNALDLEKWLRSKGGSTLVAENLATEILKNHWEKINPKYSYGLGWVPYKVGEHYPMGDLNLKATYFIHGGSTEGYQSIAVSVNEGETLLVILSNSGEGQKVFELAKSILHEIYP